MSRDGSRTARAWMIAAPLAWLAACAAPVEDTAPWSLHRLDGNVLLLKTEVGAEASPDALPVYVRPEGDALVCGRRTEGENILVNTFEREGDDLAYGAYGLGGAKNHMPFPRPLHGDPIDWDQRDHRTSLLYQLELVGVPGDAAIALVDAEAEALFAEGLRVFFLMDGDQARRLAAPDAAEPVAGLLWVEVPERR